MANKTIYEQVTWGGGSVRATLNTKTGVVSLQYATSRSNYNFRTKVKVKAADFYEEAERLDIWNPYNRHPEDLNTIAVRITGEHLY